MLEITFISAKLKVTIVSADAIATTVGLSWNILIARLLGLDDVKGNETADLRREQLFELTLHRIVKICEPFVTATSALP